MPKGETSRPYNRKEKKAAKTIKNVRDSSKDFSLANKANLELSKKMRDAKSTLSDRKSKEHTRKAAKLLSEKLGASSLPDKVLKRRERAADTRGIAKIGKY